MAEGQQQQQTQAEGIIRVAGFQEEAKGELRQIFAEGRAEVQLELKKQGMHELRCALRFTGGTFLIAVVVFIWWLICGSPCSMQILAFLAAIAALLIASLSVLVGLTRFTGSGSE